jgi:cell division protein FtsB
MANLKRKNNKIREFYSKIIILVLFIFVLFAMNTTWNLYKKYRESKFNRDIIKTELEKLKEREKKLSIELDKLNTARGVEEELRKKFGIVKDKEGVVVIIDKIDDGVTKDNSLNKSKDSLFKKFINIFKN